MGCEHLDVSPNTMKQVSVVLSVLPCVSHRCNRVVVVVSDCLRCEASFQRVVPSLWSMASLVAREAPVCLYLGVMPEIVTVSKEIETLCKVSRLSRFPRLRSVYPTGSFQDALESDDSSGMFVLPVVAFP